MKKHNFELAKQRLFIGIGLTMSQKVAHIPIARLKTLAIIISIAVCGVVGHSQPEHKDKPDPKDFYRGIINKSVLQADLKVYRVYRGEEDLRRHWYTLSPPTWSQRARKELALPLDNKAVRYAEFIIPKGTTIYLGIAASKVDNEEFGASARGGGPQIWIHRNEGGKNDWGILKEVKKDIPVPQTWWTRLGNLDSYLPKTYREAWAAYGQTSPRQLTGFTPDRVIPKFVTDKNRISEAVKTYGTFPGGILLEASANFSLNTPSQIKYDKESNTFLINNTRYAPGLESEEIAILHHFVSQSQDNKHFGAVAQDKFYGVPEDSVVTLWLSLADSELGGYAYGYDAAYETFYPPEELGYTNPELLHLSQIGEMNLKVIGQDIINSDTYGWQPRIFLRSHDITFRLDENTFSVDRHSLDVNFQVFREYGDKNEIEYSLTDAKQVEPYVANSVKWVSDNLPAVLKSSSALSRIVRYGEVLALLRFASKRKINIENANELESIFNQRRKIPMTSDVYAGIGEDMSSHIRATSILLEAKFRNKSDSLNPIGRLVVMMELMKLSSMSSDASQLARYRQEAINFLKPARDYDKSLPANQRYEPEVFEYFESFIKETKIRSIAHSIDFVNEYLKNNNLEPALAFLTTVSEACSEIMAEAIETELYRDNCNDVNAKLTQAKQAQPSNPTTESTPLSPPPIPTTNLNIVILITLGTVGLLIAALLFFRRKIL